VEGWHHLSVAYRFGEPESVRGTIDGKPVKGTWDMNGATTLGPVTDDDELWIGAGNKGGKGNGFDGWIDNVTLWRGLVPEEELATRYQHVTPPPAVVRSDVPSGSVLVQICEKGVPPSAKSWPDEPLAATESYTERAFGFFEEPIRYVATGVRGDRANPHLFRAAAAVRFPAGKHRLLSALPGRCEAVHRWPVRRHDAVSQNGWKRPRAGGGAEGLPRSRSRFPLCATGELGRYRGLYFKRRRTFRHPGNPPGWCGRQILPASRTGRDRGGLVS